MPTFSHTGLVWVVGLSDQETNTLTTVIPTIAPAAGALFPPVSAALLAAVPYIQFFNALGGHNGVDVNGAVGAIGVMVTPHASGIYQTFVQAQRLVVSGELLANFIVKAAGEVPAVASTLGIPVVGAVFTAIGSGTPFGWALAGALGLGVNKLLAPPDPNAHGAIHADRAAVGDWERLLMVQLGGGDQIALLAWQGFFSAQGGGGADVYANRPQVGDWEKWTLVDNHDGTISLRTSNGHFLTALNGGDSYCMADRTTAGNWEKFFVQNMPGGHIALKTHDKGKYLSVQPEH